MKEKPGGSQTTGVINKGSIPKIGTTTSMNSKVKIMSNVVVETEETESCSYCGKTFFISCGAEFCSQECKFRYDQEYRSYLSDSSDSDE
jgi:hypothetical protein